MIKKLLFFFLIVFSGGLGGVVLPNLLSPVVSRIPFLQRFNLSGSGDQTVIVQKTEHVVVEQFEVAQRAYVRNIPSFVSVRSSRGNAVVSSGFGFMVGSDGSVLTRREWVNAPGSAVSVVRGSDAFSAEVIKKSDENGLALLKIKASNLPVVSFARAQPGMGMPVFILGTKQGVSGPVHFMNKGIVKSVDGVLIETNIKEDPALATGIPLLDFNGDVVGITSVNSSGYVFAISAEAITNFLRN